MSRGAVTEEPTPLGRGRSGVVFKVPRAADDGAVGTGDYLAVKVFTGEPLAKLVLLVLTGAPNPYIWNEHAIRCAVLRRRILAGLVEHWFDGELNVANAVGSRWNEEHLAFELAAEFAPGRTASLHHPYSAERDGELRDLLRRVMDPLQRHLVEAGFDGLVWQAGKGNPVATNNFLLEDGDAEGEGNDANIDGDGNGDGTTEPPKRRWTWIDLESGVPGLFPINPLDLLGFYLPRSFRHRRPLFDDVDVPKLERWLDANAEPLAGSLGAERVAAVREGVAELGEQQDLWRRQRRGHRSIEYAERKGRITAERAAWFRRRVPLWYGRMLLRAPGRLADLTWQGFERIARFIGRFSLKRFAQALWLTVVSQRYRMAIAHRYVAARIDGWQDRGQLTPGQAEALHENLDSDEASAYLTDFGMHIAIKPFVKICQWWIIAPLILAGVVNPVIGGVLILTGGMIGRTLYTGYRFIQAALRGRRKPWVALVVGLLPMGGNAAYPLQVIYSGTNREAKLAQFIVYNTLSRLGELMPIWGGPDTRTEHFFNRFGDLIVRDRSDGDLARSSSTPEPRDAPASSSTKTETEAETTTGRA